MKSTSRIPDTAKTIDGGAVLLLDHVSMTYTDGDTTRRVLDDINLVVNSGETVALMGPSGSGKSTVMAIAGGLEIPTTGSVQVDGVVLDSMTVNERARLRRSSIGYVFQDFNLLSSLTALDNVALPLELDGTSTKKARQLATEALEIVGMGALAQQRPDTLSGGERQRVAIARAIVGERRLVLADEPTGALDTRNGDAISSLLTSLAAAGAGVLIVTHDYKQAAYADRIVQIADGVIHHSDFPSTAGDIKTV